jgi:hypothetical protein
MNYARLQGKTELVSNFERSAIWAEDPKFVPILCHSSGECAGTQDLGAMGRLKSNARNAAVKKLITDPDFRGKHGPSVKTNISL